MGRKESGRRKGQAYWEAYAAKVDDNREAAGADAAAARGVGQTSPRTNDLYMTVDEYLGMLTESVKKTYSLGGGRHHPEDIAVNVEAANEILWRSMGTLIRRRWSERHADLPQ